MLQSRLSRSSTADKHEPAGSVENGNGAAGSKAASEAGSDEPSAAARDVDDSSEAAEPDSDDSDASESLDILGEEPSGTDCDTHLCDAQLGNDLSGKLLQ